MKKLLFPFLFLFLATTARAGDGDYYVKLDAGFLLHNTLNASVGIEKQLLNYNAYELSFEGGNRFELDEVCGHYCRETFWDNYYWGVAATYKHCLSIGRNTVFRACFGPECGSVKGRYFAAVNGGFELSIVFFRGAQLVFTQKNQVGFFHGDDFRNGLTIGLKLPL